MKVKKRNGEIVDFKRNKVFGAITRASESMNIKDKNLIRSITDKVITKLGDREEVNVEYIQDIVEETLMAEKQFLIARAYILWRQSRNASRQVASSMGVVNDLKLPVSSLTVLAKRYLLRNIDGDIIETPKELYKRVSTAIAKIEEKQGTTSKEIKTLTKEFYDFMASGTFLPNSPCLFSAGTEMSQLSACFTLNIDDSLESIFDVLKKSAKIFQTGGGVGYNFSNIRPKDDVVRSTKGVSSGPLSFMKVYNEMCEIIKQGCVSTSTLIRTENGVVPIGNFLNTELAPQSVYASNRNLDTAYLSNDNGVTDALSITTNLGLSIDCTKNHHFKTVNEDGKIVWKKAEELKEKDWLIAVKGGHVGKLQRLPKLNKQHFNSNKITVPEVMNEGFAELLGLYMSNGCINNGRLIFSINSSKSDLKDYIVKQMKDTFSLDLGYVGNKDGSRGNYFDLCFYSRPLCNYLEALGYTKKKSVNAFIPQVILSSPENVACAFLRGYFEGDGSTHEDGYPTLASASENLVNTVQQLLLSLGIVSSKGKTIDKQNENHITYTLAIVPEKDVVTFIDKIGFISGEKKSRQAERLHTKSFEQVDIIPNTQKLLNEICPKGKRNKYYHYLTENTTEQRNLTRKRLERIFDESPELAKDETLKTLMNDNFYYTQITGIENTRCYTVDIETSAGQYVANGLLVHNSFRRGAMMGILDVNHPNILDFIIMKGKEGYLSNFNISVAVTDNFMKAVKTNKDIQLVNPRTGKPIQSIPASAIWDLLVTEAWKTGDPGLVFIDTVNKSESNVVPKLGPIKSCNPCGEIFMYPSESCNLGSLNLTKFTKEKEDGTGLEFDFNKLGEAVKLAIRFLDNVIDANKYPTQEIQDMSLRLRRIGLGVMGWADTLILLKIPYDSQEALDLAGKVMGFITKTATKTSVELGERRGSFPEFEDSIWAKRGYKHMRNSAVTCIAPTGSISILAGCSQSIEPLMSVVTVRNLEETLGSKLVDVNPLFQQEAIKRGFWSEELMNKVSRTLSIQNMQEIPEDVRRIFVTAMDVKPEWHVRMQAAFQANTHNACSKTINLPHNATPHDVEEAFMLAWKLGAKGITVFRDGCLRKQVFTCVECEVPT